MLLHLKETGRYPLFFCHPALVQEPRCACVCARAVSVVLGVLWVLQGLSSPCAEVVGTAWPVREQREFLPQAEQVLLWSAAVGLGCLLQFSLPTVTELVCI